MERYREEVEHRNWETLCLNRLGQFHETGYLETSTGIRVGPETILRPKTQFGNHIVALSSDEKPIFIAREGFVELPIKYGDRGERREDLLIVAKSLGCRKRTDNGCFFALYHYYDKFLVKNEPPLPESVIVGFIVRSWDRSVRGDINDPYGVTHRELWLLREFLEDIYETEAYDIFSVPLDGLWEKIKNREEEVGDIKTAISGE